MMQKIGDSLQGKRVLITQSEEFMGPVLCDMFQGYGAEVIGDPRPLAEPGIAEQLVADSGHVDVLIANLAVPAPRTAVTDVTDEEWQYVFSHLSDPLPRLFRAVLPQMIAQNFVENPTYYPPEIQANAKFQERLKRDVPLGRLATPEEDAQFAVFLAASEVNFFVGQSIAFSGGWVT